MNEAQILAVVQNVFRDVFDVEDLIISNETNSEHIEDWDSLMHINLVVAIEKELKIKFNLLELQDLKNVGEMVKLIQDKLEK